MKAAEENLKQLQKIIFRVFLKMPNSSLFCRKNVTLSSKKSFCFVKYHKIKVTVYNILIQTGFFLVPILKVYRAVLMFCAKTLVLPLNLSAAGKRHTISVFFKLTFADKISIGFPIFGNY